MHREIKQHRLALFAHYMQTQELKSQQFFDVMSLSEKPGTSTEGINEIFLRPILELPHVFPNEWFYDKDLCPFCIRCPDRDTFRSITTWFLLGETEFEHLFCPGLQNSKSFGGKMLKNGATVNDFTKNLVDFVSELERRMYYQPNNLNLN